MGGRVEVRRCEGVNELIIGVVNVRVGWVRISMPIH